MSDQKPFNDAVEHMKRIEGLLRYFEYFYLGFFAISILFIVLGVLIT